MVDAAIEKKKTGAEDVLWDLSIFYSGVDDPAIQRDLDKVQGMADAFAGEVSRAGSPASTPKKWSMP